MEPDVKQAENMAGVETPGMNLEEPGILTKLPALGGGGEQWKTILDSVYKVLAGLPDYLTNFLGEYRKPLVTLGLIFGSVVSVKLTLALLDAVNDIPLLAPTFELIGFAYTAWFIYRYMLKATNREELSKEFSQLKDQVLGKVSKL